MLTFGIPSFRLQKDVVEAEIDVLRELGVVFRTGVEVGRDVTIAALREQGYEAFYLAIGAQGGRKLGVDGEETEGVLSGIDFVRRVNLGEDVTLSGKVVVIGGGNVAIDVARTAARVEADRVTMVCLESAAEMPASPDEVEEARQEGVLIQNGWGPAGFVVKNGRVSGVKFRRCTSVFDRNGRFAPVFDERDTRMVEADWVLLSIGQSIEWGELLAGTAVVCNRNGTAAADAFTYQTAEPDIFVGGDVLTGPRFAIDAIAAGKQGAISIHRHVQPGQSLVIGRDRRDYKALDKESLLLESYDRMPRQRAPHAATAMRGPVAGVTDAHAQPHEGRIPGRNFIDDRGTFTEAQVRKETERCLGCGAVVVDEFLCVVAGSVPPSASLRPSP
jgi:NADPH-dependent glutamate synthase beta subunit-like oxidoreductase